MLTIIAGRLRGVGEPLEFLIVRRVKLARLKNWRQVSTHRDGSAQQAAELRLFNKLKAPKSSPNAKHGCMIFASKTCGGAEATT
jgi:hypothetical protein